MAKMPTNPSNLGVSNQRLILQTIVENEPISRAQLARLLSMSKPSIADNVSKLIDIELVREVGEDSSSRSIGRKGTLLGFNKNHKYIVVIDFYYEKTMFSLTNLEGSIINEISVKQTPHQDFELWVAMSVNTIKTLMDSQSINDSHLAAIGICSPGIINKEQNQIIKSTMYGTFDPIKLRTMLKQQFNCPIYLSNATNASALGEWSYGAGSGYKNVLYISCGIGLGSGIIIENKLYEGSQFAAGEIANFVYPNRSPNQKSLEERIGISALLALIKAKASDKTNKYLKAKKFSLEAINDLLLESDKDISAILTHIAIELGYNICNLVMVLNCDLVILGGEYRIFADKIIPIIQTLINKHCVVPSKISKSQLGEKATTMGITKMCREFYFDYIIT